MNNMNNKTIEGKTLIPVIRKIGILLKILVSARLGSRNYTVKWLKDHRLGILVMAAAFHINIM